MDDIEKHKEIRKCEKSKKIEKIENLKSCGSLNINDGLRNFDDTNVINAEPKSTKLDEPILERVKLNPPHSLRDHFCPPRTSQQSCFNLPFIPKDVTFKFNLDHVGMLPKFTGFEDPYLFIREFEDVCLLIHMPRVQTML